MNNALVVTLFIITWSGMALFGYVYVINKPKYAMPTYPTYDDDDVAPRRRVKIKDRLQKFVEEGANGPVIRNQVVFPKANVKKKTKSPTGLSPIEAAKKSSANLKGVEEVTQKTEDIMRKKTERKKSKNVVNVPQKRSPTKISEPRKTPDKTAATSKLSEPTNQMPSKTVKESENPKDIRDGTTESSSMEKAPEPKDTPSKPNTVEDQNRFTIKQCKKDKMSILQIPVTRHNKAEVEEYITSQCTNGKRFQQCEHTALVGPLKVRTEQVDFKTLYAGELSFVKKGGWWVPHDCLETQSVAIVIPFRNRYQHLPILLRQLVPILYRQRLHHRIFVVEQDDQSDFNRGKLMNVGYAEALKQFPYKCFVFHDVDLIPEDDNINYGCVRSPMHLSVAIDKFNYRLPYSSIFGGIEMFTTEDYKTVNGFSNIFYSWGGEDDVLSARVKLHGMKIHRQSVKKARYTMLRHTAKDKQRTPELIAQTDLLMRTARNHPDDDGVSSLQYKVNDIIDHQLYTLIKVDLQKEKEETFGITLR